MDGKPGIAARDHKDRKNKPLINTDVRRFGVGHEEVIGRESRYELYLHFVILILRAA